MSRSDRRRSGNILAASKRQLKDRQPDAAIVRAAIGDPLDRLRVACQALVADAAD